MPLRPPIVFVALIAFAAFVLLAGLFPDADPARSLPGFQPGRTIELIVEAPAKAHEARNWALFGEWHRNEADNYQFWRVQAPVWVYPLAWAFQAFGVSYPTLRLFSVIVTGLGLAGFLVLAVRRLPPLGAMAAAWLLVSNVFFTQIARSGLVEVAIQTGVTWMVLALVVARAHPLWLVAAQAAFTAAFFAKSGAVYAFPMLVVVNVMTFLEWSRHREFTVLRWAPVATAVAIAAFTAWYVLQPEYLRTLEWNTGHLLTGLEEEQHVAQWWNRFDLNRLYYSWWAMFPGIGALGLPAVFWLGAKVWSDRGRDRFELILFLWVASALLVLLVSRIWTMRHSSILFFPNYLVIGWAIAHLAEVGQILRGPTRFTPVALGAGLLLTIGVHVAQQVQIFAEMRWDLRNTAQRVMAEVGPGHAVFVGRYAVPVLLETPYDTFYVKPGFNTDPDQINALQVTHGLVTRSDVVNEFLAAAHPRFRRPSMLGAYVFRDELLGIHAFPPPLNVPKSPAPTPSP